MNITEAELNCFDWVLNNVVHGHAGHGKPMGDGTRKIDIIKDLTFTHEVANDLSKRSAYIRYRLLIADNRI